MWKPDRKNKKPLYQQISEYLEMRIRYCEFPAGSKLPSERKLAEELNVNRSTVVQAYEELRAAGLVQSNVGFGTTVIGDKWGYTPKHAPNWRVYEESGTFLPNMPFIRKIREEIRHNPNIIDFASGELSGDLFPNDIFKKVWHESPFEGYLGYEDPQGYLGLRETIVSFLQEYHHINATTASILITSGSQQSLFLITQCLLSPGDAVAIEYPSYCYSLPMFQSAGLRIFPLPVDRDGINPEDIIALHRQHRIKMIFLNPNYQNPTGTVLQEKRRERILDITAELGVPIVEDDPFSLTSFEDNPPLPLKAFDTTGNVIYIGSLSKIAASGFRIGWMAAPQSVIRRLTDARQQMDFGLSVVPQWIASQFLGTGNYFAEHIEELRLKLQLKRDILIEAIDDKLKGKLEYTVPEGGLNLWGRITKSINDQELLEKAIERGIVFVPGGVFGSTRNYVRFSYARPDKEVIYEGITIFEDVLRLCR
ncbi:MAG: GntR family transcriptional regulator [Paenibacillus sp.]|jgi:DNA-binding transcriptional MocR family regulator|nr:GntR family transcriptional regulator [Paenibacillus sp.]